MNAHIHPALDRALAPFAPAQSSVQEDAREAAALRADLRINELKNSGELRRQDDARAFALQLRWGVQ